MESITGFLQKWRVRLGHLFAIVVLIFAKPTPRLLIAGTVVALTGEAIRVISAGCIRKDTALSRSGPYAFTRNPLYVGSFLMYLGLCIAASNLIVTAVYIPFFFVIYYATIFREEAFLREAFGADYAAYCADTPLFYPQLRPPARNGVEFSFSQAMKNREYEAFVAVIILLGVLWAMYLTHWRPLR